MFEKLQQTGSEMLGYTLNCVYIVMKSQFWEAQCP